MDNYANKSVLLFGDEKLTAIYQDIVTQLHPGILNQLSDTAAGTITTYILQFPITRFITS